jgi:RNA polymerase sigma-70 factor (ECF subfamily)
MTVLNGSTPEADMALVAGVLGGNRLQTELFVRSNAGWMLAVARRYLRDEALAEDCVQESFASAFACLGRFEGRARLRSWLHRIVVNAALMKLRTIRRRHEEPIEMMLPALDCDEARVDGAWSDGASPHEALEQLETCAVVKAAIAKLPEPYRIVMMMRDIDDLDTTEVAQALAISEANVKVRLHRARRALKKLVAPLLGPEIPASVLASLEDRHRDPAPEIAALPRLGSTACGQPPASAGRRPTRCGQNTSA